MQENKLTYEECKALYFDSEALLEPTRTIYRLSGHLGGRYYYAFDEAGEIQFYISVTNKIQKTMPTSPFLIDWIASMGRKEAKAYANFRADYGSLMHIKFSSLLINKSVDLTDLEEEVEGYLKECKHPTSYTHEWTNDQTRS